MKAKRIHIEHDLIHQRIDNFLTRELKGVPKSRIYRAIRGGEVRVNGKRVKADYRLEVGDEVRVPPIRQAERPKEPKINKNLEKNLRDSVILDEKPYILINKPAGLAVHGGSGISLGVIEGFRQLYPKEKLELIHRLDKGTSGCLLIAKKRSFLRYMQEKLREKDIDKRYLLIVHGEVEFDKERVDIPLQKFTQISGERMVVVNNEGKPSVTIFRTLSRTKNCSLLEAQPITGRTHQIRVHAKEIGHPIVGDEKYGDRNLDDKLGKWAKERLWLHASSLAFKMPDNQLFSVCSLLRLPAIFL